MLRGVLYSIISMSDGDAINESLGPTPTPLLISLSRSHRPMLRPVDS